MANKTVITLGFIVLTLLTTGVILQLNDQVRLRVNEDKSTFYVPHETYPWIWTVSGREYNRLFDGSSIMNRQTSGIIIDTTFDNLTNEITIKRITPYIRGPTIIDTYEFDGDIESVELFPISHTIEVYNASGKFYRYTVDDLTDTGPRRKLTNEVILEFGKNMKVKLHPNYRWAWIGWPYGSDSLSAQYNIPTDYEVFNVRLFDPPPAEGFFHNNISATNLSLELGTNISLTANLSQITDICIDINHPDYGKAYECGVNNLNFTFVITNFRKFLFNNGDNSIIVNFSDTKGNFTINDTTIEINTHQYDFIDSVSLNITGLNSFFNLTSNVTLFEINSTNIDRYYPGFLIGDRIFLNLTSEEVGRKNLTYQVEGTENFIFFNLDDNIGQDYSFSFNMTGFSFGVDFFDNFTNYTFIDLTNLSAQLNGPNILANGTNEKEFIYDDFEDGSFNNNNWLKTADTSTSEYTITNTEASGRFRLRTTADVDGGGTAKATNRLIVNNSRFNLQHVGNITLNLDYNAIMEVNEASSTNFLINNITLGNRLFWLSNWTNCIGPVGTACTAQAETLNGLIFNISNQLNGTFRVKIVGIERSFGTRSPGSCGSYNHTYDWTDGTYKKSFSACSDINGILNNDFIISPDYEGNPSLDFGQGVLCTFGVVGCKTTENNFNIQNVNRTMWQRFNGTVISTVIYESPADIQRARLNIEAFVWHTSSLDNVYTLSFLSADNGTTWDEAATGTFHTFTVPGKLLRWRIDFVVNQTNQYFNDSFRLDTVNLTIDAGLPTNITIDWGDDGIIDATFLGELNDTNSPFKITLPSVNLTDAFNNASRLTGHTFSIPLGIRSDSVGVIQVDDINLTYDPNPVFLNITFFESYLNNSINQTNLTIPIGANNGVINITDLRYDFAGGNDTISLLVFQTNQTINRFNNTLTEENLSFSGNQNITRYLDIPLSSEVYNATLNLSSFADTSTTFHFINNLISYWPMNESSGDMNDSLGLHNGTVASSVSQGEQGILGTAYGFDAGVGTNVTINDLTFADNPNNISTISLWVNFSTSISNNVFFSGSAIGGGGGSSITGTTLINNSRWNHIVVTTDKDNIILYINGTLDGSVAISNDFDGLFIFSENGVVRVGQRDENTSTILLGDSDVGGNNYLGELDEIAYWNNRNLSSSEVSELYNDTIGLFFGNFSGKSNITNPYLEIGTPDGIFEWSFNGQFSQINNQTKDLSNPINAYLDTCIADANGNCSIPFLFHSDTTGVLNYSDINIFYHNRQINETLKITNYFSQWDFLFGPPNVEFLEFIPTSPTSKGVQPFGQTFNRPILNLTNIGYHTRKADLSLLVNDSLSCVDLYISLNSTKPSADLWNNLSGHWAFDIDARDLSGNGNDGIITGATFNGTAGQLAGAFEFDGTDDFININTTLNGLNSTTEGTWTAWVKPTDATPAAIEITVSFGDTNADEFMEMRVKTNGDFRVRINSAGINQWMLDTDVAVFSDNIWTHIAVVQNGTDPVLYVNGTAVAQTFVSSTDKTAWFNNLTGLDNGRIGDRSKNSDGETFHFDGTIDDVRIYNSSLSSSAILELYDRQNNKYFDNKLLQNEWYYINNSLDYLDVTSVWKWVDYSCSNNPNWTLFNPSFFYRQCAFDTICEEGIL